MRITYTINTRTECVGFNESVGSCVRLCNGHDMKPIDCNTCWAYQVVDDKAEFWRKVEQDVINYGNPLKDRISG